MYSKDLSRHIINSNASQDDSEEGEAEIITSEELLIAESAEERIIRSIKNFYKENDKLKLFWADQEYPITESFINLVIIEQQEIKEKERRMKEEGGNTEEEDKYKGAYREQRISSYEEIHKPKKEIKIEELFKDASSKKLVIYGRAGIGKTTLCQYLTVAWQNGEIWQDKFKLVIKIPLRELANQIEANSSLTLEGFISELYGIEKLEEKKISEFLVKHKDNILFILDGYDEIVPLFNRGVIGTKLKKIVKKLLEEEYVTVTSRPLKIEYKFDQELENVGFIDQDIERYIKIFKPERAESILKFLKNNKSLWGIAHIPINLELICSAWGISGGIEKIDTISELYATITRRLLERYIVKNHYIELEEVDEVLLREKTSSITRCLEKIAFRGMESNKIIISIKDIRQIIEEEQNRIGKSNLLGEVLKSGLLKVIGGDKDGEVYFLHLSFQEYYAAKFIARSLENLKSKEYEQAIDIIREHKYTPYYEVMWWFTAGLLYQKGRAQNNYEYLSRFWEIIESEPKDLIGVRHANLVIRCLEECKASDKVAKHKELIDYIKKWIRGYPAKGSNIILKILCNTPNIAKMMLTVLLELLEYNDGFIKGFILSLYGYEGDRIRRFATKSLGKLGHGSPEVISALIEKLKDESGGIIAAAKSLGKLGYINPKVVAVLIEALKDKRSSRIRIELAEILGELGYGGKPEVIAVLVEDLKDEDKWVRIIAAKSLGKIGQGNSEVVAALIEGLKDEDDKYVRGDICRILGELGQGSPQVISTLMEAFKAKNHYITKTAAKSLGKLGHGSPEVISALIEKLKDKDSYLRRAAAKSLGNLGQSSNEVISALIALLKDEDKGVWREAAKSLGKLGYGSTEVISALIEMLKGADDWYVRHVAAKSLGKIGQGSPQVISALIDKLKDEDDKYVRGVVAKSLGKIGQGSPQVISTLIEAFKAENHYITKTAAKSLGKIGYESPEVIATLIETLNHESDEVRQVAVESLGKIGRGSPNIIAALTKAFKGKNEYVKKAVANNLVAIFNKSPELAEDIARLVVNKKLIDEIMLVPGSFKLALTCFTLTSNAQWLDSLNDSYVALMVRADQHHYEGWRCNALRFGNIISSKSAIMLSNSGKLKLISGESVEEFILNKKQRSLLLTRLAKFRRYQSIPNVSYKVSTAQPLISKQEELYQVILENNHANLEGLISNGVDLTILDKEGNTPLHYTIKSNADIELIKIVVKGDANLNAVDRDGNTAFNLAVKLGKVEIANYLENKLVVDKISKKADFSKNLKQKIADATYQLCQEKYKDAFNSYQAALSIAEGENNQVAYCYILLKLGDYYLYQQNNYKSYKFAALYYSAARVIGEIYSEVNDIFDSDYFAHKQLYLETLFLKKICKKSIPDVKCYQYHKERLKEIRAEARSSADDKGIEIKKILQSNTQYMVELASIIFMECISLLGIPPCEYAIVGLGSMARKEISIYSDIEYMILLGERYSIEDPRYQYFVQLALLFELKVISIGETFERPLPLSLEQIIHKGFSLDEGPNTPNSDLHKGNVYISELINIPHGIAELQSKVDCIMANALRLGILIQGNSNLFNKYQQALGNELYKQFRGMPLHQQQALELMEEDIGLYKSRLNDRIESLCFNAKADMYRFISNIINHLSLYYSVQTSNSWDRLEELKNKEHISEIAYERLSKLLDFALKMRIKTHLFYEREKENIYSQGGTSNKEYQLNEEEKKELEEAYKILVAIHKATKEFIQSKSFYYDDAYEATPSVNAKLAIAKGSRDEGIRLYQEALSADADNLGIMRELVDLLKQENKYDQVLKVAQQMKEVAQRKYGIRHDDAKYASEAIEFANFKLSSQSPKVTEKLERKETLTFEEASNSIINSLFKAVKRNNIGDIQELIERGIDINCRESNFGSTTLHIAAKGNIGIVSLLIENKAQLNPQDEKGRTPLHLAAKYNQVEVVKLLLEKGADREIRDKQGFRASDYINSNQHRLRILLESQNKGKERNK
ncbi:HEAT repeat domain-containing protein [Holosporaceae bacterium 'Namur']|nr:HEAT repeat domain-containing protein [Holosporaceae bacterium 'Namur']